MAELNTFPQSGDEDPAENFAQMIGQDILSDFVATGFEFTPNYTAPEVTIGTGLCFISKDSETVASVGPSNGETRLAVNYAVQLPEETISLTDSETNYIYVVPDFGTNDNASFQAYTSQASAGSEALLIGEVDTSNDTTTEINRDPSSSFQDIDVTSAVDMLDDVPLTFGADGDFVVAYDSANDLLSIDDVNGDDLVNLYEGGPVELGVVLDLNNNDLVDGSTVIWDQSAGYIPQGRLENDSLTVTAGDGLKDGGSVALGATTTLNIEPADFAGAFVSDDGSDNLAVNLGTFLSGDGSDNITVDIGANLENDGSGNIVVDEDYAFTFTSTIQFGSDIETSGGTTIWDASAGHVPRPQVDDQKVTNTVSSNYTTSDEEVLYVDSSGGPVTITLASADVSDGNQFTIVDVGGAASSNNITIDTEGGETINGGASVTIENDYSARAVSADGTNWWTAGGGTGGGVGIEDDTTSVVNSASAIDFNVGLNAQADGDGSATVVYQNTRDPRM